MFPVIVFLWLSGWFGDFLRVKDEKKKTTGYIYILNAAGKKQSRCGLCTQYNFAQVFVLLV